MMSKPLSEPRSGMRPFPHTIEYRGDFIPLSDVQ